MPIIVACPSCSTRLNAPDGAAGKKVKCPKCQTICDVPVPRPVQFEVLDDATKPEQPTKTKTKVKADASKAHRDKRHLEDEEADRPRRRKDGRGGHKSGRSPALLIGAIAAAVLVFVGTAFSVYWFVFRGKSSNDQVQVSLEDWKTYTSSNNVFRVSFPGEPENKDYKPVSSLQKVTSEIRMFRIGETDIRKPSLTLTAGYVRFSDQDEPAEVKEAQKWLITMHFAPAAFGGGVPSRKVTAGGRVWEEQEFLSGKSKGIARWHQDGHILYLIGYRYELRPPDNATLEKFFASFEFLGGVPSDPDPVNLDGWVMYTSPENVFKASFPGETKTMTIPFKDWGGFKVKDVTASEFRVCSMRDEKSGRVRTYVAGYLRFPQKPTRSEIEVVTDQVREELGNRRVSLSKRRVSLSGWPWGMEHKGKERSESSTCGILRWVLAGSTIYAVGIKDNTAYPSDKVMEKFFGSFEILDAKPDKKDLEMPTDWTELRMPEFRAITPSSMGRIDDPYTKGPKYDNVPIISITQYRSHDCGHEFFVSVVGFHPNTADTDRQRVLEALAKSRRPNVNGQFDSVKLAERTKMTWGGQAADELSYEPAGLYVGRVTHTPAIGFVATVSGTSGKLDPNLARAFLDSLTFTKIKTKSK